MKILVIGKVWPEPKSSAAGRRMVQLIDFFQTLGDVLFVTSAKKTGFECELLVRNQKIKLNDVSFDDLLKKENPEIVVFDRFMTEEQFSWKVKEICPNAMRILNTEDLHFLRKTRERAIKKNRTFENLDFNDEDAFREIASIHKSDIALIISDFEFDFLVNEFNISKKNLFHLPIYSEGQIIDLIDFEERKDLVFIGNFLHSPNLDAVRFLKNEIWTEFRNQRKDISIHIYGAYPTQEVLEMNAPKELFFVHGRAEDVSEIMKRAKICFAPVRFGAGIKGKIIDAMEAGLPIITTSIGAEGIADLDLFPGFITDEINEMIVTTIQLHDDSNLWKNKQALGKQLLDSKFKKSLYLDSFKQKITDFILNIEEKRSKSFESNLIQYHSFQNSKYFSKWIKEKKK